MGAGPEGKPEVTVWVTAYSPGIMLRVVVARGATAVTMGGWGDGGVKTICHAAELRLTSSTRARSVDGCAG